MCTFLISFRERERERERGVCVCVCVRACVCARCLAAVLGHCGATRYVFCKIEYETFFLSFFTPLLSFTCFLIKIEVRYIL